MKQADAREPSRLHHGGGLVWFVIGLPAVVVVAGFVTLFLAIRASDDVVRDDYRREGLAIYPDPARDAAATAAGASARLDFDAATGRLDASLSLTHGQAPDSLVVVLSHGTRAELDRMVTLTGHDGAYSGTVGTLPAGHWYVEITPEGRGWRLKGDFTDLSHPITLRAAGVS